MAELQTWTRGQIEDEMRRLTRPDAAVLRSVRLEAGASQVDVAAELGLTRKAVSGWETGRYRVPVRVGFGWARLCAAAARRRRRPFNRERAEQYARYGGRRYLKEGCQSGTKARDTGCTTPQHPPLPGEPVRPREGAGERGPGQRSLRESGGTG